MADHIVYKALECREEQLAESLQVSTKRATLQQRCCVALQTLASAGQRPLHQALSASKKKHYPINIAKTLLYFSEYSLALVYLLQTAATPNAGTHVPQLLQRARTYQPATTETGTPPAAYSATLAYVWGKLLLP